MTQQNVAEDTQTYDVGGVLLPRPFKIRRFGHFGFNVGDIDAASAFYVNDLGFQVTDQADLLEELSGPVLAKARQVVTDPRMIFTSNSSDHHALLLAHRTFGTFVGNDRYAKDNTISQITFQAGSLEEVVRAEAYLRERGVRIGRVGRDMPGSNWHVYFLDPDGNTVELYYGMEQIGWNRRSKPRAMHNRGFRSLPPLPQISEAAERAEALERGIDLDSGWRPAGTGQPDAYDVGGVLLPRPFKVTKLGPLSMFTEHLPEMLTFYTKVLGLEVVEESSISGARAVFLRSGTEHHTFALVEKSVRSSLGLSERTSCLAIGLEVGSYSQLRDATAFLGERGHVRVELPPELYLGIDYAAHFRDPDGHLMQLYYYMEQVGWDGSPRPAAQRRVVHPTWPQTLAALSDTYADQTFMGPLG